jgi:SAM-dependent methyltransferase
MDLFTVHCHHCHAASAAAGVSAIEGGVTSDCRPWNGTVRIAVCPACAAVQAPIDDGWRRGVDAIYREYDTYAAAGGEEQKVIGDDGSEVRARSRVIIEWLGKLGLLRDRGAVLDVGCGRGAFLGEFSAGFPGWDLGGTEFDDRNLGILSGLPSFTGLQTAAFGDLAGEFDLISMIHVLEHIEDPVACLSALRRRTREGALVLVQVPDWLENPFALTIADHATHFTADALQRVTRRAGWEPVCEPLHVVPKELTLLARAVDVLAPQEGIAPADVEALLAGRIHWLEGVRRKARKLREDSGSFGIFGTAVAATWLVSSGGLEADFLVDEDPSRIGSTHLGIPILAPSDVPEGSDVFIGLAPAVSRRLAGKFSGCSSRYHPVGEMA